MPEVRPRAVRVAAAARAGELKLGSREQDPNLLRPVIEDVREIARDLKLVSQSSKGAERQFVLNDIHDGGSPVMLAEAV
jgi:hypothetical protein